MIRDCVKDGEWGFISFMVLACMMLLLMVVYWCTLIFVEKKQILVPHCKPVPHYVIRNTKDWLHEDIGTIRMSPEETMQECGE